MFHSTKHLPTCGHWHLSIPIPWWISGLPTIQNSQEVDPTSCIVPLDESGEGKDVGTDFPKAVVNFSESKLVRRYATRARTLRKHSKDLTYLCHASLSLLVLAQLSW